MRPSAGEINLGKASTYVERSFSNSRKSRIFLAIGNSSAKVNNTSSPVAYWPVLVFFALSASFNLSNKTSPNCFGEPMLNVVPANSKISCCTFSDSLLNSFDMLSSVDTSRVTPSFSISANTSNKGISISRISLSCFLSLKACSNFGCNESKISACSHKRCSRGAAGLCSSYPKYKLTCVSK